MNFLRRLLNSANVQRPPIPAQATAGDSGAGKAERLQPNRTHTPTGSKVELISMIGEMTEIDRGGLTETETKAANAIAASNKFSIEVVKELVLDSFFSNLPMDIRVGANTVRFVSMHVGATMGGPSFARWLAENIVVGRQPAQMIDNPCKYGSWGMWQDAKALCEKLGVRFTGPA